MKKNSLIKLLFVSSMSLLASASLTACTTSYTVTFDTAGGTEVESIIVKSGELIEQPETSRNGYNLSKWTCEGKKWNFRRNTVTSDITLTANWNIINYSITYDLGDGSLPKGESNPNHYTVEDEFTFVNPTKEYYADCYWLNGNEKVIGISKGSTGDLNLTASYNDRTHYTLTITYDPVDCSVYVNGVESYYHKEYLFERGEEIVLKAVTYPYRGSSNCEEIWKQWCNSNTREVLSTEQEFTFIMPEQDITICPVCTTIIYETHILTITNDPVQGQAYVHGIEVNQRYIMDYAVGKEMTLKAITNTTNESNTTYVWKYWYNATDSEIISYDQECTYTMPDKDVTICPQYEVQLA